MSDFDWTSLDHELALWRDRGLALPLWWRDDDAIAPTPQLDRLIALSEQLALPVHLAIIPKDATEALVQRCAQTGHIVPVVHGWRHKSHAPATEKKAEFGAHRPLADLIAEVEHGLARLNQLFPDTLAPIFVPPWNRITPDLAPELARLGYGALSTFTPRRSREAAPGVEQINTHLDPIDWKGSRSLVAPDRLIAQVARDLQDRRTGATDNTEPYGVLTHHLVHDDAIWRFTQTLIARLLNGPAQAWTYRKGHEE